jgi:hypothetical protein
VGLEYASMLHNARLMRSTRNALLHPDQEAKRTHLFDDLRDSFEKHHLKESKAKKDAAEQKQREMRKQEQIQSQHLREEKAAHTQQCFKTLFGGKRKRDDMR